MGPPADANLVDWWTSLSAAHFSKRDLHTATTLVFWMIWTHKNGGVFIGESPCLVHGSVTKRLRGTGRGSFELNASMRDGSSGHTSSSKRCRLSRPFLLSIEDTSNQTYSRKEKKSLYILMMSVTVTQIFCTFVHWFAV